jgi:transposase
VDALGNPLRVRLTPGQRHGLTRAEPLIAGLTAAYVIADAAFDADPFRARLAEGGATAAIPSNRSRARAIPHDRDLYKERHVVECFINKIKHYRRIATRYEKTARNFLAMIHLACAMVWLRSLSTRPSGSFAATLGIIAGDGEAGGGPCRDDSGSRCAR